MLLINCYTRPIYGTKQIQAHDIRKQRIVKSYSKMSYDNLSLFQSYNNVVMVNVSKVSELDKVNFVNFK